MDGKRFAHRCLGLGVCILGLGTAVSLPVMHLGFWLGAFGALLLVGRRGLDRGPEALGPLLARPAEQGAPGLWWLLGAALWQQVAMLAGPDGLAAAAPEGSQYAWLAMPLVAAAGRDPRWRERFTRCLVAVVCASALVALLQFTLGYDRAQRPLRIAFASAAGERVSGFFSHHLTQASVMATTAVLLLGPPRRLGLTRRWAWPGRAAAVLGLLATQARGALLGALAGAMVAALGRGRKQLLLTSGAGLLLAGSAVAIIAMAQPGLLSELGRHQEARLTIWRSALDQVRARPLLGSGGKRAFRRHYLDWLRRHRPDLFAPELAFDPDDPSTAERAWPAVFADQRMRNRLQFYRRIAAAEPDRRAEEHAQTVRLFDDLSGRRAYFPYDGAPHAHSTFLTLAANYGLPCALLHLLGMVAVAAYLLRRIRPEPRLAALGLGLVVYYLVAGLFEDVGGDTESVYALWAALGVVLATMPKAGGIPTFTGDSTGS